MIQIRRGEKENWLKIKKPLADGQPGFDKKRHKIKIGNGTDLWEKLNYATGLFDYEILNKETKAKERYEADNEDITVFSYGTDSPDENTVGRIYLQYYDAEPEVDYIVESGVNGIWSYQKWHSGIARCYGTFELSTDIATAIDDTKLYQNSSDMDPVKYPFIFKDIPSETATIHSPSSLVWLASSKGTNTTAFSAIYKLISTDKHKGISYKITLNVDGKWR